MIEDVQSGRLIQTVVQPVERGELQDLGSGWRFDWLAEAAKGEANGKVFKLIDPEKPDVVLGLMALRPCTNYLEVTLLENNPENVGSNRHFRGIAGSLLAFAAQLSFQLGGEGFIAIDAKTELIEHYHSTYGFVRLGSSHRMVLGTRHAAKLIEVYGKGQSQ